VARPTQDMPTNDEAAVDILYEITRGSAHPFKVRGYRAAPAGGRLPPSAFPAGAAC
jgi:hypothetical protein